MKAIDFTQPGGFPLTQDQLAYMQSAYTDCINALGGLGCNNNIPTIITGIESTAGIGGITNVSAGWFFYNGEVIYFPAQSYLAVTGGNAMYIVITPSSTPLFFNDGSTPNVILDKQGILAQLINTTPTDSTHFLLNDMVSFGVGLGLKYREQTWQSLVVSTPALSGGVSGTVFYKKNLLTNTMQIRAYLGANNAQNFHSSPGALYSLMGTLPVDYFPVHDTLFIANYFISTLIKDDLGIAWIKQINCAVNTAGQLMINWLKPDAAILGYGIEFNTIIPLD